MTNKGFDFFEGTAASQTSEPRVTIRRGGLMVLTPAAVDLLGGATHVQLGLNSKTHEVAIRRASEEAKGRYRLRTPKKGTSRLVGGRPFFAYHGIPVESARTFEVESIEDGLIGFRLSDGNGGGNAAK